MEVVGFAAVIALLIFLLFPGVREGAGVSLARQTPAGSWTGFSPTDTVTIVLTAATLVLAGVALIVSLLAFVGYTALKELATSTSKAKASEIAGDVARAVAEDVAREVSRAVAEREVNARLDSADAARVESVTQGEGLSEESAEAIAQASGNPS